VIPESESSGVLRRGPMIGTITPGPERWETAMNNLDPEQSDEGFVTKVSARTVDETVARLTGIVASHGLKLFAVIDQRAAAREVGMELRETVLVLFGSPAAGTPVMEAAPMSALDLPLKVVIWADGDETKVSYLAPDRLAARYRLPEELGRNLAGINIITDALVAP
jgi:uncharacterized protein (DUF302 family)